MSFAKVYAAQPIGLSAEIVPVEVDISRKTLHSFSVVGLPDKAVAESRDRVSAAVKNAGFSSPKAQQSKIVVSLAPADLKKEGPLFDVAIALGYLAASGEISFEPEGRLFLGELSLDGFLRHVKGVLPLVAYAKRAGFREVYVPEEDAEEGAVVEGVSVFGVAHLSDLVRHLDEKAARGTVEGELGEDTLSLTRALVPRRKTDIVPAPRAYTTDFSDIRGQETAKRGLEVAAAGGHNVLLSGPPGTGKTLLAKAFAGILPDLEFDDAFDVTAIHSIAGLLREPLITSPPFRSPHHTASFTAIVGGGSVPRPGEVTLAHKGL
ncbi:MAG: magnesium chelatase, partial [Candidatus Lloydbacteria bacterium CG22_combo_CG10-13_8_21_14_all_47_15]